MEIESEQEPFRPKSYRSLPFSSIPSENELLMIQCMAENHLNREVNENCFIFFIPKKCYAICFNRTTKIFTFINMTNPDYKTRETEIQTSTNAIRIRDPINKTIYLWEVTTIIPIEDNSDEFYKVIRYHRNMICFDQLLNKLSEFCNTKDCNCFIIVKTRILPNGEPEVPDPRDTICYDKKRSRFYVTNSVSHRDPVSVYVKENYIDIVYSPVDDYGIFYDRIKYVLAGRDDTKYFTSVHNWLLENEPRGEEIPD